MRTNGNASAPPWTEWRHLFRRCGLRIDLGDALASGSDKQSMLEWSYRRLHNLAQLLNDGPAVNLRMTSPETMPRTPPSSFVSGVILPDLMASMTSRALLPSPAISKPHATNACLAESPITVVSAPSSCLKALLLHHASQT